MVLLFSGIIILTLIFLKIVIFPPELGITARIAGLAISSSSMYPFFQRFGLKRKISNIEFLIGRYQVAEGDEKTKLESTLWKCIETNIIPDLKS